MNSSSTPPPAPETLREIANCVGAAGVIDREDYAPFLTEWRKRWTGRASMIVAPATPQEVAAIMKICARAKIAVTPQGGNTGLVGGQTPFGPEVLMTLKRLRTIRSISRADNAMTLDAGVTLREAQNAADEIDRLFPLSIGSEGSCQIGGVISTNAGGVNVLRYGSTRNLTLGLEVVTPRGEIWDGLKSLRKDNTGYDLKQLFIGGEGTLGVVTGAVIKLVAKPTQTATAFVGLHNAEHALDLLDLAQRETGERITSFELIGRRCIELTTKHIPGARDPFSKPFAWCVLLECADSGDAPLGARVEALLVKALEQNLIADATLAQNQRQRADFWRLRHGISAALNEEGRGVRCDVSVSTADMPAFLRKAGEAVERLAPQARIVAFGHVGDGNVHYDIAPPPGAPDALASVRDRLEEAVYDVIDAFNGSISAEHGVGRHRRHAIASRKSAVELAMMRAVKGALDPDGIMNPGKML